MSSAVNSIMDQIEVGSLMSSAISAAFPQAAIAIGVANMLNQAVGDAVNSAVDQLVKGSGMPSFLQEPIREMVEKVVKESKQDNAPGADEAAQDGFWEDIRDFGEGLLQDLVNWTPKNVDDEEGGSSSWLVAIAKAMGGLAGKHAAKLVDLSQKMEAASAKQDAAEARSLDLAESGDKAQIKAAANDEQSAAREFSKLQAEFQGESQLFGMLQNGFSSALKSIGEGLSTMARAKS